MNKEDQLALARYEVEQAMGYDGDVLASIRENALKYYQGEMEAAPEGRSQIISYDVADTVNSLLAQIKQSFSSSIIEFEADSEQDEPQAQLESDVTRKILEKCSGVDVLSESAHDALLIGNGYLKVFVDEQVDISTETYNIDLLPEQLANLSQPLVPNQEVDITETNAGYRVKRTTTTRELMVESKAPEVMLFSNDQGQFRFQDLRFVGERILYTTSELISMGVSPEDAESIPLSDSGSYSSQSARQGPYQFDTSAESPEVSEQLHECYDCYIMIDTGNGVSERRNILFGGSVTISNEPAECIPYATGSPVIMPHRVVGIGMYEMMYQIQNAKTTTMRNFIDNLTVLNGSRMGVVEGKVNMQDATSGRINGLIRMKSPDSIVPLPATDIGPQAIGGMNYLDTVRSSRGGASVDLGDADRQLMQSSATAAAGAMESQEKMAGWYCANMVNSMLKSVYMLIHKKLRLEMDSEIGAKLRGKWVSTTPSEWKERKHITVHVGMTSSERTKRQQALTMLLQQQQSWMQQGFEGIITDRAKVFNSASDWIRANDLGAVDEYLTDPSSEEAQQAAQQLGESQKAEAEAQKKERDDIIKIEAAKVAQDRYETDVEYKFKYYELGQQTEVEEAKLTTDAIVKLKTVETQNDSRAETTGTEAS